MKAIGDGQDRAAPTLAGLIRLRLQIRRCGNPGCARHHKAYRPEAEAAIVLPPHGFGLEVIALIGALRYREQRSVPEIHRTLREREVAIAERTVTHLLDRDDELGWSRPRSPRMTDGAPFWPGRVA